MRHLVIVVTLLLSLYSFGAPPDELISAPSGWQFHKTNSPIATSPTGFAIAAYKHMPSPDEDYYLSSKVLQWSNGTTVVTEIPGKVAGLRFSPNGQNLLVKYAVTVPGLSHQIYTALLRANGMIQWTEETNNVYRFTDDGSGLWYATPGGVSSVSIVRQPKYSVSTTHSIHGAYVLAGGAEFVLAFGRSVSCEDAAAQTTTWEIELPENTPVVRGISRFNDDLLKLEQWFGSYVLISKTTGAVVSTYNSRTLANGDPTRTFGNYASYKAFQSPFDTDQALLFDTTAAALQVQLTGPNIGAISGRSLPATKPSGFEMRKVVGTSRLFLVSEDEVIVRHML